MNATAERQPGPLCSLACDNFTMSPSSVSGQSVQPSLFGMKITCLFLYGIKNTHRLLRINSLYGSAAGGHIFKKTKIDWAGRGVVCFVLFY